MVPPVVVAKIPVADPLRVDTPPRPDGAGVVLIRGVPVERYVGKNLDIEDLKRDFDAVVLCIGSTIPRDLPVPEHFDEPDRSALLAGAREHGNPVIPLVDALRRQSSKQLHER